MTDKINPTADVYADAPANPREQLLGLFKKGQRLIVNDYYVTLKKDLNWYALVGELAGAQIDHITEELFALGYTEPAEEEQILPDDHAQLNILSFHDRTPNLVVITAFVLKFPKLVDLLMEYRDCKPLFDEDRLLPVRVLFEVMARLTDKERVYPSNLSKLSDIDLHDYPQVIYDKLEANAKVLAGPDGGPPTGKVDPREAMSIGQEMLFHEIHLIRAEKIATYGFTLQGSWTAQNQQFMYTIGLDAHAHLELLIAGNFGSSNAASMLSQLARRFKDGEKIDTTKEFTLDNFTLRKAPVNGVILDDINDTTPPTHVRFKFKEWTFLNKEDEKEIAEAQMELELIFEHYTRAVAYKTSRILQVLVADANNVLPDEEGYEGQGMLQELVFPSFSILPTEESGLQK